MKSAFELQKYIHEIELNGLRGRMVNAPAISVKAKNLNILLIHGHHSSHERLQGVAELLQRYGNICMPDLPGFGGMTSLFSIGEKPTIENMADYLAAFIKMQYGNKKKFVLVGYSMGFMVVTKLLQKYPELHKQIIEVVAVAGLVHQDDIKFSKTRRRFYMLASYFVGSMPVAFITKLIFMRKWFLGLFYANTHNAKQKFDGLSRDKHREMVDFEVNLWRINDIRTWCFTTREMLNGDLLSGQVPLPIDLISVVVDNDHYFDNKITEQHFKVIYRKVKTLYAPVDRHGGSKVDTAEQAMEFIPKSLRNHLKGLK